MPGSTNKRTLLDLWPRCILQSRSDSGRRFDDVPVRNRRFGHESKLGTSEHENGREIEQSVETAAKGVALGGRGSYNLAQDRDFKKKCITRIAKN